MLRMVMVLPFDRSQLNPYKMENVQQVKNRWSEVKIRKLDDQTCDNIAFLLVSYKEVSAAVAVRRLINNYPGMKGKKENDTQLIRELRKKVSELQDALERSEAKVENIKSAYKVFCEIIQ